MGETYDFSGWATRNNLKCADGRTIRKDAFKDNDGKRVPLVWQHMHDDPANVLGHAILENRPDGVYTYCKFNNTEAGRNAKSLVEHQDVTALSIYANKLKQNGGDVLHGAIREVSLVLAGANPGAYIDVPIIEHSGDYAEAEAIIYTGEELELMHACAEDEKKTEKKDTEPPVEKDSDPTPTEKTETKEEKPVADNNEKTVQDVFNELTDEQKNVVYFMIGQALEDAGVDDGEEGDNEDMKHNVFENDTPESFLSHSDIEGIFADAKRCGSLRDAVQNSIDDGVLAHAVTNADGSSQSYGIADINYMFPDAQMINGTPDFIKRDNGWVNNIMNGTHHTPFSRVKSMFANVTEDEARAKGYIKGKQKKDEVFSLLKRTTDPQTIYKKQKLDRDDIIDITDFDVVAWLKGEMRIMLDEELARAILVGDGRLSSDDDKISADHIRPIVSDADLYAVKVPVAVAKDATDEAKAKAFIKAAIKSRKEYKGSGSPSLYVTEDMLADMLLIEDGIGHLLYPSESALATTLRVKEIVTVPVMDGVKNAEGKPLAGVIVNLADYNIGADKGGAVSMFDDFDIDYNQQKYLMETRCSGALIKPYSALVLNIDEATA